MKYVYIYLFICLCVYIYICINMNRMTGKTVTYMYIPGGPPKSTPI